MNAAVIGVLLSMVILPLFMGYIRTSSFDDGSNMERYFNENEYFVIKYSKKYNIVGIMAIMASVICVVVQLIGIGKINDSESAVAFFSLVSSLFLLGVTIFLIVHNTKIELFDDRIVYSNMFNLSKKIYWQDIKKVEYSNDLSYIIIKTDESKIKVSTEMPDYESVIVRMGKKIDRKTYNEFLK